MIRIIQHKRQHLLTLTLSLVLALVIAPLTSPKSFALEPISISNQSDLEKIGKYELGYRPADPLYSLSSDYVLTGDIVLDSVLPIEKTYIFGDGTNFTGSFNGGGYRISGLTAPLFDSLGENANSDLVSNLYLSTISGGISGAGILAEYSFGPNVIRNVHVTGKLLQPPQDPEFPDNFNVGGLIGTARKTTIENSSADIVIAASYVGDIGGLVGDLGRFSTVRNSASAGSIVGQGEYVTVGGLVGSSTDSTIINASSSSSISIIGDSSGSRAGGLIGFANQSDVSFSIATGSVSGGTVRGDLFGYSNQTPFLNSIPSEDFLNSTEVSELEYLNIGQPSAPWAVSSNVNSGEPHLMALLNSGFYTVIAAATFTITVNPGLHGSISPSTSTSVAENSTPTYTITPDSGYVIDTATVNSIDIKSLLIGAGSTKSYTFGQVIENKTIAASFRLAPVSIQAVPVIYIPTYRVNYLANGVGVTSVFVDYNGYPSGGKIIVPGQIPVRTGHTFLGWNSAANGSGTNYPAGTSFTVNSSDIALYAQWKINSYSLAFNANGGQALGLDSLIRDYGSTTLVPQLALEQLRTGYTFLGWNNVVNGAGRSYSSGDTYTFSAVDTTLWAQWKVNSYTVTYDANESKIGKAPSLTTQEYNSTITLKAPSIIFNRSGYTFQGWNTAKDGSGRSYLVGESFVIGAFNQSFFANWLPNTYRTKFINTARDLLTDGQFSTGGSIASAPTPPKRAGYTLKGWSNSPSKKTLISFPYSPGVARNITLYAVWMRN